MQHFNVSADDFFLPDIRIGTYPTFVELMNGAGVQVFLQ
jgi:hypothetical protein